MTTFFAHWSVPIVALLMLGCRAEPPEAVRDAAHKEKERRQKVPMALTTNGAFSAGEVSHEPKVIIRNIGQTSALAFSPDGATLASCNNQVHFWNPVDGAQLGRLGERMGPRSLAYDPTGTVLAIGDHDWKVTLREVNERKARSILRGHKQVVLSVGFSADGNRLATGGHEKLVKLWSVDTGDEKATFDGDGVLAFDGRTLAWVGDYLTIRLFDVGAGKEKPVLKQLNVHALALNQSGTVLAAGSHHPNGPIEMWDLRSLKSARTLTWPVEMKSQWEGPVYNDDLAFSPDEYILAACGGGRIKGPGCIFLWDVGSGRCFAQFIDPNHGVYRIAFNPAGDLLASAHADGTIRIWDVGTIVAAANKGER